MLTGRLVVGKDRANLAAHTHTVWYDVIVIMKQEQDPDLLLIVRKQAEVD